MQESDAILFGAVGGPKWDRNPPHQRPEKGLLKIRKELTLIPTCADQLLREPVRTSPLKQEIIEGIDFLIVRELTGGLYFGKPSERVPRREGSCCGYPVL